MLPIGHHHQTLCKVSIVSNKFTKIVSKPPSRKLCCTRAWDNKRINFSVLLKSHNPCCSHHPTLRKNNMPYLHGRPYRMCSFWCRWLLHCAFFIISECIMPCRAPCFVLLIRASRPDLTSSLIPGPTPSCRWHDCGEVGTATRRRASCISVDVYICWRFAYDSGIYKAPGEGEAKKKRYCFPARGPLARRFSSAGLWSQTHSAAKLCATGDPPSPIAHHWRSD